MIYWVLCLQIFTILIVLYLCYLFRSLCILCTACRILTHRLMFFVYIRLEIKLILSYLILCICTCTCICIYVYNIYMRTCIVQSRTLFRSPLEDVGKRVKNDNARPPTAKITSEYVIGYIGLFPVGMQIVRRVEIRRWLDAREIAKCIMIMIKLIQ